MSEFSKWVCSVGCVIATIIFILGAAIFLVYYPLALLGVFVAGFLVVIYTFTVQVKETFFD